MQQAISFRDNDGYVVIKNESVYRYVQHSYTKEYDHLINSGLYRLLVDENLLISHSEIPPDSDNSNRFYKILQPEKIDPIIFPCEWTVDQWKEVINCFLQINTTSIRYGMILKDATPFNFTFRNGKCIFFDTLSFALYKDGDPWIAYRQFCESMLGPFLLIRYRGHSWARMMQTYINGWPLYFISSSLPRHTWFNTTALLHIHWHARFTEQNTRKIKSEGFTKDKLTALWSMLTGFMQKQKTVQHKTNWSDYYENGIRSSEYLGSKINIVSRWISQIKPQKVIDLGANNGRFSILASEYASKVIAVESDEVCVEQMHVLLKEKGIYNIETIVADITQPTAGTGWQNREKQSLLQRLHCDTLLSLALIHHLCIASNIPLDFVADMFADMTSRFAIVEFIPITDPKVEILLLNRKNIFTGYTEEKFIQSFSNHFKLIESAECASTERKLFLWEKK